MKKLAILLLISNLAFGKEEESMQEKISRVENGLIPAIRIEGSPLTCKNILEQMKEMKVPAASIAVINDGKIEWSKAYGELSTVTKQKATTETRFQAGSVSKPVAAFAVLSLVDKGLIELDEDINQKLTSWQIPESEFTRTNKITLRHLLSHSSGLNVIGFNGYKKNEPIPTIIQSLDGLPLQTILRFALNLSHFLK